MRYPYSKGEKKHPQLIPNIFRKLIHGKLSVLSFSNDASGGVQTNSPSGHSESDGASMVRYQLADLDQ
jgi:hypothetical protein